MKAVVAVAVLIANGVGVGRVSRWEPCGSRLLTQSLAAPLSLRPVPPLPVLLINIATSVIVWVRRSEVLDAGAMPGAQATQATGDSFAPPIVRLAASALSPSLLCAAAHPCPLSPECMLCCDSLGPLSSACMLS